MRDRFAPMQAGACDDERFPFSEGLFFCVSALKNLSVEESGDREHYADVLHVSGSDPAVPVLNPEAGPRPVHGTNPERFVCVDKDPFAGRRIMQTCQRIEDVEDHCFPFLTGTAFFQEFEFLFKLIFHASPHDCECLSYKSRNGYDLSLLIPNGFRMSRCRSDQIRAL